MKFGYLRENQCIADKENKTLNSNELIRTGLDIYLHYLFPNIKDWSYNKNLNINFNNNVYRRRPDYFSPSLNLIVEYDGLPHYQNYSVILKDLFTTELYKKANYNIIRIPCFIQLTSDVVKQLFNIEINHDLFPNSLPSFNINRNFTPDNFCPLGLKQMVKQFKLFPNQYMINKQYLIQNSNRVHCLDLIEYIERTI